ncbi:serine dehydratase-like isoform X1 [Ictalurus furcatus]|uniref:serine dehydratase-like isoform X1 n=1 Tax=Ictalurus furcatus TaxID=66913 RepID=UPI0023507765|nr:serine dehydratase-like isoform X1 [Ictalurus furcatus]
MSDVQGFHINSPLIESIGMSKRLGFPVYLKMESSQPSGSFKIRGIGHLIQQVAGSKSNGVICSSGGNAGLATAYAARKLNIPATIIVPSSSPKLVLEKLQDHGASVRVVGKVWDEANAEAVRLAESENLTLVPPFDHPLLWKGHSSLVHELKAVLPCEPGAVVLCVGGGGLFCGVVQGLDEVGWGHVPILCMETVGADCFNAAVKAGRLVTLPDITSEAKCLGAKTACSQAFEYSKRPNVISELVTDRQALQALELFLDEERVLVELACAASLAAVYSGVIQRLQDEGRLRKPLGPLVVIVCGGSSINLAQLQHLRTVCK